MFKAEQLPLFVPQVIVLSRLMFTGAPAWDLGALKAMVGETDRSVPAYLS